MTDNNINPLSGRFKQTHEVMIITGDGNIEHETIQGDITITNDVADPALVESITSEICNGLTSGSIREKGIKKVLPFINSGGGTCNSVLDVYLLPPYEDGDPERLYIILSREDDESAGTVAFRSIPFDGNIDADFKEYIRQRIIKTLTKSATELGLRASRRAAYSQHVAGQHRPKD